MEQPDRQVVEHLAELKGALQAAAVKRPRWLHSARHVSPASSTQLS